MSNEAALGSPKWNNLGNHYQFRKDNLFRTKVDVHIRREEGNVQVSAREGFLGTRTEAVYFNDPTDEVILSRLAQR